MASVTFIMSKYSLNNNMVSGMEQFLFIAGCMVQCFGFVTKTVLQTHLFGHCY